MNKKILIIGAGPGALAAAMLLQAQGFSVEIFEKNEQVGGRTSEIVLQGYHFDVGPTFLMMKFVLEEIFATCKLKINDYLEFIKLDPMYRLQYEDNYLDVYQDKKKMQAEIDRVFPEEKAGLEKFYQREKKRYESLLPLLLKDNNSLKGLLQKEFRQAFPHLSFTRLLYDVLGDYFKDPKLRIAFTFQAKYLGMSPWECPASFALVPYVEHALGIYHVKGGFYF